MSRDGEVALVAAGKPEGGDPVVLAMVSAAVLPCPGGVLVWRGRTFLAVGESPVWQEVPSREVETPLDRPMIPVARGVLVAARARISALSGHWAEGFTGENQPVTVHDQDGLWGTCLACSLLLLLDGYLYEETAGVVLRDEAQGGDRV